MADSTLISWTNHTWNPFIGCTKVSPGCKHCYAETLIERMGGDFTILRKTKTWGDPGKWQRSCERAGRQDLVFTCSMSDFFHPQADQWRSAVWKIIKDTPSLIYQILTKRPERIVENLPPDWNAGYANVWLGISVESPKYLGRMDVLRRVPAAVHFISAEPLLEDISSEVNLDNIQWVIVGGESGPGYRGMPHEWARRLLTRCRTHSPAIPFFFKQSAAPRTEMGVTLDGQHYKELPMGLVLAPGAPVGRKDTLFG